MTNNDTTNFAETTVETATCNQCSCTSTLPELFRKSWQKRYCPACALKIEVRNTKILFVFLGIFLVLELVWDGLLYGLASWETWSLMSILLISTLSLVLHELSHALVAWLLSGHVFGIHIGLGKQLFRGWLGNFYLGVSLFPVSGLCYAGFPTEKRLRLRYAIYISGGLLFHLVVLLISIPLLMRTGNRFPWLDWVIIINGLILLLNAWPRNIMTAAGRSGSDGMLIWRLLTGKLTAKELRQTYYRIAAYFAYLQEQPEQVGKYVSEGLKIDPTDGFLENLRVFHLLKDENRLEDAYTAWKAIVESEAINAENGLQRAVYFNNYAWTALMHQPDHDSLQTARHFAEEAYSMAPWSPVIKGTLAAVFVEQGEYQQGIEWALAVAKEAENESSLSQNENIASNLATAALGYARLGDNQLAAHLLQKAVSLAPEELMVQKAKREI